MDINKPFNDYNTGENNYGNNRQAMSQEQNSPEFEQTQKSAYWNRIFPILISIVFNLIFYFYLLGLMDPKSYLPRLFIPEGSTLLNTMVPVLTLFFFVWSILDMLFILGGLRKEDNTLIANKRFLSSKHADIGIFRSFAQNWTGSDKSLTFRKFSYLVEIILTHKNIQSVYVLFKNQTELESEKATSKYTLVKIAIWAMPILGFIGTVLGISMSVANFSGFLTQDIEKIELVKVELAKVTTGLSFAFDTTLFGLVLSMLTMFLSTYVQNFEQSYLTKLEETGYLMIDNSFDGTNGKTEIEEGAAITPFITKINSVFDNRIDELSRSVDAFVNQFERTTNAINTEMFKLPERTITITSGLILQIEKSLKRISDDFASIPESINKNSQLFTQNIESSTARVSMEIEKMPELMSNNLETFRTTIEDINTRLVEIKKSFSDIAVYAENSYTTDLTPVLKDIKLTMNELKPVLESLSKPTEIILTTLKRD